MVFKSEIKNINLVERLIDDISAKYQLHSDIYGKLLLAVVEGVNNAIVHGNKLESDKDVILQYQITDKYIQFVITDNGPGFDYRNLPDPTKPENIEKTHGRGIFLMKHLADEVEFNDKGNEVKVIFNLT
ncbi:ATP-binding protein [Anaerophaga thermohalophila]|uniref:ATP-binding protein n=1 Tax=Anaerophaga thermohalophila TaxID=177400 RepID=UPI000361154B|nr:ATP-binding protein [Anaerophaga thermohalophila]